MTGGMAFVFDPDTRITQVINPETVIWQGVETNYWAAVLRRMVEEHARETQSRYALGLLNDWQLVLPKFCQIVPKEMLQLLAEPVSRNSELRA
jgi:glutamate synthase (NADPH/NADH) large chain